MKNKYLELPWHKTWVGDAGVSVVVGLVVMGLRWLFGESGQAGPSFWTMASTFLGTTIVVMIILVRKRVEKIEIDVREHNEELAAGEEIDALLMQLQARLREVQAYRSAVFKTYCRQELEHFAKRVARAAQQGELIVNEHHFRTVDDVLAAFGRRQNRVFRGVWRIEAGERLFDTAWQQYMRELVELMEARAKNRRIAVKLLLVVDKRETLDRPALQIVVGYLRTKQTTGLNYRIINEETYEEFLRDSQLNARYIDFGVYGEELLYRTESYEPKRGEFSEDKWTIRAYLETHEAAMKSVKALPDPTGTRNDVDLEMFLQADEIEEKERGKKRERTDRGRLVKIGAEDGHQLDGILYEAEESIATVLHVHGSLGNFYQQPFIPVFAQVLTREGINLLSCNMRSHDGIAEGYDGEGEMKYVGGSLARFETCVQDIKGAVSWSRRLGPKVYLQGHSLGCDRVLHYLKETGEGLSPILLSACDSYQLQKEWLGVDKFSQQQAELRERMEGRATEEGNAWSLAPEEAYGLKGDDGWTYAIPVTEEVLGSILLGPVGRLLAIEKGGTVVSSADALAYLGQDDPIRGASMEAMKTHLKVLLPKVTLIEEPGGHNLEACEEKIAERVAEWIKERERGD